MFRRVLKQNLDKKMKNIKPIPLTPQKENQLTGMRRVFILFVFNKDEHKINVHGRDLHTLLEN